jgi:hypothetical protein
VDKSIVDIEERMKEWRRRVGDLRADEARAVFESRPDAQQKRGRATLPNLLAESWAKKTGFRYEIEVDLGWARPDLVVFYAEGAVVFRVQGDYWHSLASVMAKDKAQRGMFFQPGISIQGSHVWLVVDVWEKDIYESETAFVTAMEKEKTNGRP